MHKNTDNTSIASHIRDLWHVIRSNKTSYKKSFNEYQTVRRKYILTQISERVGKDCMEPAPLLNIKLLDIGCGNSDMAKEMVFRGAEVTAIDICDIALNKAKKYANKTGAVIEFIKARPEDLIASGETFDVLLCLDVASYVENKKRFSWALNKLLNKDGIIIFSEQHHSVWSYIWHILIAEKLAKWVTTGTFSNDKNSTQKDFFKLLKQSGFNIISSQDISFNFTRNKWVKDSATAIRYIGMAEKK